MAHLASPHKFSRRRCCVLCVLLFVFLTGLSSRNQGSHFVHLPRHSQLTMRIQKADGEDGVKISMCHIEDTVTIARALARIYKKGESLFLSGDLGSGKTCFARAFIREFLDNPILDVPSPTYLIALTYGDKEEASRVRSSREESVPLCKVTHLDLYRLKNATRVRRLIDFEDLFNNQISIIEWPERLLLLESNGGRRRRSGGGGGGRRVINESWPPRLEVTFHGSGPQGIHRNITIKSSKTSKSKREATNSILDRLLAKLLMMSTSSSCSDDDHNSIASKAGEKWGGDDGHKSYYSLSRRSRSSLVDDDDHHHHHHSFNATTTDPISSVSYHPSNNATTAAAPRSDDNDDDIKTKLVLGIETSCDDTAVAILRGDGKVLANLRESQQSIHENYGGVVPRLAKEAHVSALSGLIKKALKIAKIDDDMGDDVHHRHHHHQQKQQQQQQNKLDAVAVTIGPGLSLCLEVGVKEAMKLSQNLQIPYFPIHHLEAHTLVSRLPKYLYSPPHSPPPPPPPPLHHHHQQQQQQQPHHHHNDNRGNCFFFFLSRLARNVYHTCQSRQRLNPKLHSCTKNNNNNYNKSSHHYYDNNGEEESKDAVLTAATTTTTTTTTTSTTTTTTTAAGKCTDTNGDDDGHGYQRSLLLPRTMKKKRKKEQGRGEEKNDDGDDNDAAIDFPFLVLLVSGGHTMLVVSKGVGEYQILGSTLDDSVGEAFDKVARLLGVSDIPGGHQVELLAEGGHGKELPRPLPIPLSQSRDPCLRLGCDMSFSGLKTHVKSCVHNYVDMCGGSNQEHQQRIKNVAKAFQDAAIEHLTIRTGRAIERARGDGNNISCLVLAGGVAANMQLREAVRKLCKEKKLRLAVPPVELCTDNGVMVAWTGIERMKLGLGDAPVAATCTNITASVEIRPRWTLGPRHHLSITQEYQLKARRNRSSLCSTSKHNRGQQQGL